ncbi:regulator of nonsense transcripts 3B [Anopheles maculipalpis]|uniref:regulator of nonsense transcripts 3B n=1 Tax=Anopheles maculipalpis TaxID=1496333 RepID=UPI0021592B8C|nr:regulator of nonsense transcripts 3B [Anopheles maculipalpis]
MDKPKSTAQRATVSGGGGRDKPDKQPRKDRKDKGKSSGSGKRNKKNKKDAPPPMTRVVVRRLPPTMTEAAFCEQISTDGQMPNNDEFYYVGPDWTLGQNASCRAYINFTNPEDVFRFTDSYDGYTFVDSKGMEYQAVVEYAPFQKLPKTRSRKKDPKCNTIETDTHFLAFKEALEAEEQEALHGRGTQEFSFKIEKGEKTTTTPLLEFLAQRRQEKRDEKRRKQEEKRRMRDEERHMRKTQIARSIPDAIREEVITEIMERAVLPRLNSAQNVSKPMGTFAGKTDGGADGGKLKDEKDKKSKNKKDKERNRDRKGEEAKVPPESGKVDGGDKNGGNRKQDRDKAAKKGKDKQGKDDPRFREQNQQQQQKGERNEKSKKDKPPASGHPSGGTSDATQPSTSSTKKEVKKYSERRKETRARAETRFAEQDTRNEPDSKDTCPPATDKVVEVKKSILTANVPPFVSKEKTTILLAGHASTVTNIPVDHSLIEKMAKITIEKRPTETPADNGKASPSPEDGAAPGPKQKLSEKQREMREARKIRNKDRPSIEIYQPRKRIVSGTGKSEDDRGRSDSDRPSDNVSASASAGPVVEDEAKERRHKLTKKASDRQQRERKNGRKNSIEAEPTVGGVL